MEKQPFEISLGERAGRVQVEKDYERQTVKLAVINRSPEGVVGAGADLTKAQALALSEALRDQAETAV